MDMSISVNTSDLKINNNDFEIFDEEIDLGEVVGSGQKTARINLYNDEAGSKAISVAMDQENGFSISINRCPASLLPGKSCSLDVIFKSRSVFSGAYQNLITINQKDIVVKAVVTGKDNPLTTGVGELSVQFKDNETFLSNTNPIKTILVKNIGTGVASGIQAVVPSGYRVRINRCPTSLPPGKECYIQVFYERYRISAPVDGNFQLSFTSPNSAQLVPVSMSLHTGSSILAPETYTPVWGPFPAQTNTTVCSGSVTVSKPLVDCLKDSDNSPSPLSNCQSATPPTTTYLSPGGFFDEEFIRNGIITTSCLAGSSEQLLSVNCYGGSYPVGLQCLPLIQSTLDIETASLNDDSGVAGNAPLGSVTTSGAVGATETGASSSGLVSTMTSNLSTPNLIEDVTTNPPIDLSTNELLLRGVVSSPNYTVENNVAVVPLEITGVADVTEVEPIVDLANTNPFYLRATKSIISLAGTINALLQIDFKFEEETSFYSSDVETVATVKEYAFSRVSRTQINGDNVSGVVSWNNAVYFSARNSSNFQKIHRLNSDGSIDQVADIRVGFSEAFSSPIVFNNELYFVGSIPGGSLTKLFKINTSGNVIQVSNISNGANDGITNPIVFNNELYFSAFSAALTKLMKINTSGVISRVSNINAGNNDFPVPGIVFNNHLYFSARLGTATKLFKVSTSGVISQVSNTWPGNSDNPRFFSILNNELYFVANATGSASTIFKINAADQIVAVLQRAVVGGLINFQNKIYFISSNGSSFRKLFTLDQNGEVNQVSHFNESHDFSTTATMSIFQGDLYISGSDSEGFSVLYRITPEGVATNMLSLIDVQPMAESNGELFFSRLGSLYKLKIQ